MRLLQKFDPIAVGETDWRAFDFTNDCDGETAVSTTWTLTFPTGQSGTDPTPQSRIVSAQIQTEITQLVGPNSTPVIKSGVFSVALLGGFPSSAAGSNYQVIATVTTASGRVISLETTLPCSDG